MGHAPTGADRLLIRPASGRQAGAGLSARTHHWKDTRTRGHARIESQTESTDTNLTNAPDETPTHSQRANHLQQRSGDAEHSLAAENAPCARLEVEAALDRVGAHQRPDAETPEESAKQRGERLVEAERPAAKTVTPTVLGSAACNTCSQTGATAASTGNSSGSLAARWKRARGS